jgi:RsiW-degrading membrane proteinase PrsW (M82 family)
MIDLIPDKKYPLSRYVIGVLVAWAVILAGLWFFDRERFATYALVCGGFFLGMCAMYIAMHLYRWK